MPTSYRETVLCRYHYDALDRQVTCTPYGQANIQRFYCKSRLATEIQDAVKHCVFQYEEHPLAQQQYQGANFNTTLLAIDHQGSILNALDRTRPNPIAYTPYGHRPLENGLLSLLGFNGERPDPVTGHYHLGEGYRQFNTVLKRFNSPDSWSPFGEGGLNAYAYCEGDPRNRVDPTGHGPVPKIAAIAKKALAGASKKAKTISRPVAAGNRLKKGASSSSQAMEAWDLKKIKRNQLNAKYRERTKGLSDTILANEASQPSQGHYNVSDHLNDIGDSTKAYEYAKKDYDFEQFPNPSIKYEWTDPSGNPILDVAHFDATISHVKNMAKKRVGGWTYNQIWRLTIDRAQYIKNFTPIDLMAIRR
ncbi:RHS repeat-associated core domain-containing protein [Pseudomonas sp. PLMAX]|uniref:RHS repeat-associated core domain-containing protein n=1 Tax=Pseudomonas sp. PLMAX TaxID=2201998 RepID=UPI0038BCEDA2